jgi:hypothetical protein
MPSLVHITDEKNSARILRAGIALGGFRRAIFFMPVVQNHFISHQWLRELRRSGARVLVGVYLRLPSDEVVWAGKYNEPHRQMPLGQAIRELNSLGDPLGFEMFVGRKIGPGSIIRIRHLPQNIGWRYQPHAHGTKPCGCPACLPRGSIKSRSIRERYDPKSTPVKYETLRRTLAESSDMDSVIESLWALQYKRRKADPLFMERLMTVANVEVQEDLARALGHFHHENSKRMLLALCEHECADVKEAAAESLFQLYRGDARGMLSAFASDSVIGQVIAVSGSKD